MQASEHPRRHHLCSKWVTLSPFSNEADTRQASGPTRRRVFPNRDSDAPGAKGGQRVGKRVAFEDPLFRSFGRAHPPNIGAARTVRRQSHILPRKANQAPRWTYSGR